METPKFIIDVQPEEGKVITRDQAVKAALRTASITAREDESIGEVQEIRPIASRLHTLEDKVKVWQVLAEVIEKNADFPPKDDEDAPADDDSSSDDDSKSAPKKGEGGDLPSKIQDVIDNHDDSELKDQLHQILDMVNSVLSQLGDDSSKDDKDDSDEPDADDADGGDDIDAPTPPMADDAPPVAIGDGPKKPPFMASKREQVLQLPKQIIEGDDIKTASIHTVSRKEALADARALPTHLSELKGYKLAKLDETDTHFVATFRR